MDVASTIGIVNQKGGTGKNSSCINLGVDLAHEGEKALPVDRDPQGSQTFLGDILSFEESHQDKKHVQVQKLPLADLVSFKDHPFRVVDDDRMMETVESVKEYGVLVPIIARPIKDGLYEIVSGHRRKRACELAGIDDIPVIIRNLDDDEATIIMVDSNLQRENILPSERAKAYQMKMEAIKHQGSRGNETSRQVVGNSESADIIGQTTGESGRQVQRFIRLNSLEQPLMDKVDNGELAFTPAVELSYLKPQEQEWVDKALEETQQTPSLSQAQRIKQESKEGRLTEQGVLSIISEEKKPMHDSVTLSHDTLKKYFPRSYTAKQMEQVILRLLDNWLRKRQQTQEL